MTGNFHGQLVATRDKQHSKNHPFFELWAQGKLTKEQMAFYCTQHYKFRRRFLIGGPIKARNSRGAREELSLRNLGREITTIAHRHVKDFVAAACESESVESSILLAAPEVCKTGLRRCTKTPGRSRSRHVNRLESNS